MGHLSRTLSVLLLVTLHSASAVAETYDWAGPGGNNFRIWMPDDADVIYGVWVRLPGSGSDTRPFVTRSNNQNWARSVTFAHMGIEMERDDQGRPPPPQIIVDAIADFATQSGHAELNNVPMVVEGLSLGCYYSLELANAFPDKTLAIVAGGSINDRTQFDDDQFHRTPSLFYQGEFDNDINTSYSRRDELLGIRDGNATQIAFFPHWGYGHERGRALRIGLMFFNEVIRLRYPENFDPRTGEVPLIDIPDSHGWLADPQSWSSGHTAITPIEDHAGEPEDWFWLPTRNVAFSYRGFATENPPVRFTEPNSDTQWETVDPGDAVQLEVEIDGDFGDVAQVEFFDGSESFEIVTSPPWIATWTAELPGAHNIVAVATKVAGGEGSGLPMPFLVRGDGLPGGGGLDEGWPDAGVGPGTVDAGIAGDGGTISEPADGSCGCRSPSGKFPWWAALWPLILLWARRSRCAAQ